MSSQRKTIAIVGGGSKLIFPSRKGGMEGDHPADMTQRLDFFGLISCRNECGFIVGSLSEELPGL